MKKSEYLDLIFPCYDLYNFNDKIMALNSYMKLFFARTNKMFKYDGLPDTIKPKFLEQILQSRGHIGVIKHNNKLYALRGEFSGVVDENYFPTEYTIVNPYLNISKTYKIGVDCVVICNDTSLMGLSPIFRRYGTFLVENNISMRLVDINTRVSTLLSAGDEKTKKTAEKFLRDIEKGETGIIEEPKFLEESGLKAQPFASSTNSNAAILNLIEFEQYLKGSLWMDLGIKAPFNMKREALGDSENSLQDMSLLPFVDNMLECRKEALEEIKKIFGVEITVDFNSAWEDIQSEDEHIVDDTNVNDEDFPKDDNEEVKDEENNNINNNKKESD